VVKSEEGSKMSMTSMSLQVRNQTQCTYMFVMTVSLNRDLFDWGEF